MGELKDSIKITGRIIFTLRDILTGAEEKQEYINLVVTVGKVAIARRIASQALKANEGSITYGATGTGTTAPAVSDIKLETELARKAISSNSYSNNIAIIRTFFNTTESNGTLKEFGMFGEDASASADSGTLFNRVAINITKTASQTLTIETQLTVS